MAKVLLVDDEPMVAKALYRLLRREGYDAALAFGPHEALELLERFEPDVVISDFRMPGMTGAELLAEVHRRRPLALRLILSGCADLASVLSSINEGEVCRFLTKPWDDAALAALLKSLLEQRELLAALWRPFQGSEASVASEAVQSESKLVVRARRQGMPFTTAEAVALLARFTGSTVDSSMRIVGGLLEQHAGKVTFVAEVGADQRLTLELPLEAKAEGRMPK